MISEKHLILVSFPEGFIYLKERGDNPLASTPWEVYSVECPSGIIFPDALGRWTDLENLIS